MTVDYSELFHENEMRRDEFIERMGKMLFEDAYAESTHFIFELLQNAEDAIARRGAEWNGLRSVSFDLTQERLRVSHFGDPFNQADVRGICGIGDSTKDLTDIGRFGIGFKSVYAFTDHPEVHSGPYSFAIRGYIWPGEVAPISRDQEETVFLFPFNLEAKTGYEEIAEGLSQIDLKTLLFLRKVNEIKWSTENGRYGQYVRESKAAGDDVRRVTVLGQMAGMEDEIEEWLLFSREVLNEGESAGHVEIAFSLAPGGQDPMAVQALDKSPLVVFFPSDHETHLSFLVHGPYQTTPSRDTIPQREYWNQHLVDETALLLTDALRWLRDENILNAKVLECLPIGSSQFNGTMFEPLFTTTKEALCNEPLLPRLGGGHMPAAAALLGRTDAIRHLLSREQLSALWPASRDPGWLTNDITYDRTRDIRDYLMQELDVEEVDPETFVSKLNKSFLEDQADQWIVQLYEFLKGQSALLKRLGDVPVVRLHDGSHVTAMVGDQAQAFLPSDVETDLPIVCPSVCTSGDALAFLHALGLRTPDFVDDVIRNVISRYMDSQPKIDDLRYEADMHRIVSAYTRTDSSSQKRRLIDCLQAAVFVMAVDSSDGTRRLTRPSDVYFPVDDPKGLFSGVEGVYLLDVGFDCLRRSDMRALLRTCGVTEPSIVDVVMRHVLPKYRLANAEVSASVYTDDISRIIAAYTEAQDGRRKHRNELIDRLRTTAFVISVDTGSGSEHLSVPSNTYLPTEQLKELLSGVSGFFMVDSSYDCLQSDSMHAILEECGSMSHVKPVQETYRPQPYLNHGLDPSYLSMNELQDLRQRAGHADTSWYSDRVSDWSLPFLHAFIDRLSQLDPARRNEVAGMLWQMLLDLRQRYSHEVFIGTYSWTHNGQYRVEFTASFLRYLNCNAWVPDKDGTLRLPSSLLFSDIGWEEDAVLLSKIKFKSPVIDQLAQEAGVELELLDELRIRGISDRSTLISLLGELSNNEQSETGEQSRESDLDSDHAVEDDNRRLRPFGELLLDAMTLVPSNAPSNPLVMSRVGPETDNSAAADTDMSIDRGRRGGYRARQVSRFVLTREAEGIAQKVRDMLDGDYGKRCQICGASFSTPNGGFFVFSRHPVNPSKGEQTNHFGNLFSLCGWHYSLISYGEWVFLGQETGLPTSSRSDLLTALSTATEEVDLEGNSYTPVQIRFWNVYPDWRSDPENIDEEIRFSGPHRTYLLKLLET